MRLDIVIPAHNEESRIDPTLRAYRLYFPGPGVRFMVALDGCQDATAAVVGRHASADSRVLLHLYPKLGKGGVVEETFRRCEAELVAFVDADGSTPPAELARLVDAVGSSAGAIASRRHPDSTVRGRRPPSRVAASTAFAWVVHNLFDLPYLDTQCGAKVIRREVLERLLPHLSTRGLLFDLDLLLVAHGLGYTLVEIPTMWTERPGSRVRLIREAAQTARSLLRLWLEHGPVFEQPTGLRRPVPKSERVV